METYEKKQRIEREKNSESKETHENEFTEEAQAAATRERAEYLVKEVKNGTQQIRNIMIHTQQVLGALNALKAQLALVNTEDPASVVEDQKLMAKLKQKISIHKTELSSIKEELVLVLHKEENSATHSTQTKKTYEETRALVNMMIHEIENNE